MLLDVYTMERIAFRHGNYLLSGIRPIINPLVERTRNCGPYSESCEKKDEELSCLPLDFRTLLWILFAVILIFCGHFANGICCNNRVDRLLS